MKSILVPALIVGVLSMVGVVGCGEPAKTDSPTTAAPGGADATKPKDAATGGGDAAKPAP